MILEASKISKRFTKLRPALDEFDFDLEQGEIHGLLGQNGSGKSTFIKILIGYHAPEPGGSVTIRGKNVVLPVPPGAYRRYGIAVVHQNLGLAGRMSVLDNLSVGQYPTALGGKIRWRALRARARRAIERFGVRVDLDVLVEELPEASRAMIAIARALQQLEDANDEGSREGVLILDEPTPYLSRSAVTVLFDAMRNAASSGHGVVFVSHRLDEVREITDRVTVLRDGRKVGTRQTRDLDDESMIEMIIGQRLTDLYPTSHLKKGVPGLRVERLSGEVVKHCSFTVHEGEILGLTGLVGMGSEEIPYLIAGTSPSAQGTLHIGDATLHLPQTRLPARIRAGLVLVPADRERFGAAFSLTVKENVTLPRISAFYEKMHISYRNERRAAQTLTRDFEVQPPDIDRSFGTLSGGNQQKAILGKWLTTRPRVLILHEPTQGVDVGARKALFAKVREAADAGSAIVVSSIEYEDLANVCDRVLVFRDGRVTAEMHSLQLSKEALIDQCLRTSESASRGEAVSFDGGSESSEGATA